MSDLIISIEKFTDISLSSYEYIFHCSNESLSLYASIGLGLLQSIIRSEVCPPLKHIQLELERVIYKVKHVLDFKFTGLIESLIEVISNTNETRSTRMAWLFSYINSNQGPPYSISLALQEYINLKYKKELNESDSRMIKIIELICLEFNIYIQILTSGEDDLLITAGQTGELPIFVLYQQQEQFSLLYHEEAAKFDSKNLENVDLANQLFSRVDLELPKLTKKESSSIPKYRTQGSKPEIEKLQIPTVIPSPARSQTPYHKGSYSALGINYPSASSQKKFSNKAVIIQTSSNFTMDSVIKLLESLCAALVTPDSFEDIDHEFLKKIVEVNQGKNKIENIKKLIELRHKQCLVCRIQMNQQMFRDGKCLKCLGLFYCNKCRCSYPMSVWDEIHRLDLRESSACPSCLHLKACPECLTYFNDQEFEKKDVCINCRNIPKCVTCYKTEKECQSILANGECRNCFFINKCYVCGCEKYRRQQKSCNHFECELCLIDQGDCAKCQQAFKCKVHPIQKYSLTGDHFYTIKCCQKRICKDCRNELTGGKHICSLPFRFLINK